MKIKLQSQILHINNKSLRNEVLKIKKEQPHTVFVDFFVKKSHSFSENSHFEGHYRFYNLDLFTELMLVNIFLEGEFIQSISDIYFNSLWCEQEAHEMFGINIAHELRKPHLSPIDFNEGNISKRIGEKNPFLIDNINIKARQISIDNSFFYANSVESANDSNKFNKQTFGPILRWHNGPVRVLIDSELGEIKRLQFELGFGHKAIEKIMEGKNITQIPFYLERLSFIAPQISNFAYSNFIENSFNISVPDKAYAIRMSIVELSRIFSHLNMIRNLLFQHGIEESLSEINQDIGLIRQLFLNLTSNNYFGSYIIPGGVKSELPKRWSSQCLLLCNSLSDHCNRIEFRLNNDRFFNQSLRHTVLDPMLAFRYGVLGPNIRASGVNFDFRTRPDYYFYKEIDFDIPLGIEGNVFDRFKVRIEEIKQSIRIITQVLDQLPAGQIIHSDFESEVESSMSNLFKESDDGIFRYNSRNIEDGPEGPLHLEVFMQSSTLPKKIEQIKVDRFRYLTNSYATAQAFPKSIIDTKVDTLFESLASFNINFAEIDR